MTSADTDVELLTVDEVFSVSWDLLALSAEKQDADDVEV